MPPLFDDVVYLFYAQSVIRSAGHQTFFATIHQIADQHSPLTTLFGVIGYSLIPKGDIGPYIVGSSHVFLYLLACLLLLRKLPLALAVGVVCAVGGVPMIRNVIAEFRPEAAWATFTAVCVIGFFAMNLFAGTRWQQVGLGILAGVAVISKPTTAPVTMVVVGAAFMAAALAQYMEGCRCGAPPTVRTVGSCALAIVVAALLVVAPIGAIIGREIYGYIVWVMTEVAPQTGYHGAFGAQLLYYSLGPGGQLMLGWARPICLAVWLVGLGYVWLRQRTALLRILALLTVIAISYAIPSATVAKSVWFGMAFDALLVLATVYLIGFLYGKMTHSRLPPRLGLAISPFIAVAGIAILLVSNLHSPANAMSSIDSATRNDITERTARIWDVLRRSNWKSAASESPGHLLNVMTIAPEPINGPVISLYSVKEDLPFRDVDYSYARSVDELIGQLRYMDYVVVGPSYSFVLSGASLGDALRDAMNAHAEFVQIAALPVGRGHAPVYIYERKSR